MSNYTNEVSVRVFNDVEGVSILVEPNLELDMINIKTTDKVSEDWYGKIDISLPREGIQNLIDALMTVNNYNNWDD